MNGHYYMNPVRMREVRDELSHLEHLLLRKLLDYYFEQGEMLVDDPVELARLAGYSPRDFKRHWPGIKRFFDRCEGRLIFNDPTVAIASWRHVG